MTTPLVRSEQEPGVYAALLTRGRPHDMLALSVVNKMEAS
jgi:hypothetical protein